MREKQRRCAEFYIQVLKSCDPQVVLDMLLCAAVDKPKEYKEIIDALLDLGADVTIKTKKEKPPWITWSSL